MTEMRVVFRVEGEPSIGLGHVMRCMALAQCLVKNGHEVFFFMSRDSENFCLNRTDWPAAILPLADMDKSLEPEWLVKQCTNLQADWLVLDGYQFDQGYRQSLQSDAFKLVVFDDMNNSGELYADMVINGARNADQNGYHLTAPKALLALGADYQVLRQEFLQLSNKEWSTRKNLTLTFGGSDPKKITLLTLQSLLNFSATNPITMPITIITGAAYEGVNELAALIQNSQLDITHLHDCQEMAAVLVNSQLVISAAGGSQFELLACATPAILVVVAENQKNASQDAANQGWCQVVYSDTSCNKSWADELALQCLSLWQQPEMLLTMHNKALQFPAIDGAKNIVGLMARQEMTNGNGQ